jgi:hypothetical protein
VQISRGLAACMEYSHKVPALCAFCGFSAGERERRKGNLYPHLLIG